MSDIGLLNEGNTCYMNSALQCIMHVPELKDYFLTNGGVMYKSQQKYFLSKRTNILKEFADQFQVLLKSLCDDTDKRPVRPLSFRKILSVFKPIFRTAEQQDAHECMTVILDTLDESLKMSVSINITGTVRTELEERKSSAFNQYKKYLMKNGYSFINSIFYGQLESIIKCANCNHSSYSYDPFSSIEVEIPSGAISVYDCLDNYCYQEQLSSENMYNCDKCSTKSQATKILGLWSLPTVLIIQLKRFGNNHMLVKNNTYINFPNKLNMTKYTAHPNAKDERGNIGLQMYDLIGIIEHSGNLNGGHYTSKCKYNDGWYNFNDAMVNRIEENQLITPNAYVLFYRMDLPTRKIWNK